MRYENPTILSHHLVFLSTIKADFTDEFGTTARSAFAEAWETLEYFLEHTPSAEGKEMLGQCLRNLHVALEHLERGDDTAGGDLVLETEELLEQARQYIKLPGA